MLQYKPIRTTRFVVAGTIEERILKLQEKKQAVFEGTVGECVCYGLSTPGGGRIWVCACCQGPSRPVQDCDTSACAATEGEGAGAGVGSRSPAP